MDEKLLNFLLDKGVPAFNMSSGLTLADFGWGTPTFHKMGREKINLIYTFTKLGFDVLLSDVDTVWLRNPVPYMQQVQAAGGPCLLAGMLVTWYICKSCCVQYPDADVLTSSDHLINTVTDEGLERWPDAASAANIGIMLFRPKAHELAAVSMLGCAPGRFTADWLQKQAPPLHQLSQIAATGMDLDPFL
jgi:hypothetical protein